MLTRTLTAEHGQVLCSPENPYRLATDTLASPSLSLSQIVDEESAEKKSLGMSGSCEVLIVPPQHPVTCVSICLQTHILTRVEQQHKHTHNTHTFTHTTQHRRLRLGLLPCPTQLRHAVQRSRWRIQTLRTRSSSRPSLRTRKGERMNRNAG